MIFSALGNSTNRANWIFNILLAGTLCLLAVAESAAQDTKDTTSTPDDVIYNRPFITNIGASNTSIGGYAEGNTNYFSTDGISDGFSMEMRRFNIFLYSAIGTNISFISELEFEEGTEEINLETALIDFEVHPSFILRGGIILPAIGRFNQNHDGPKWDFVDRPLVSTQIIPSTLSEVGFGAHGKFFSGDFTFSYQAYATNGLQQTIIRNEEGRTFLPAGKTDDIFAEDNNGSPAVNGKIGISHQKLGDIGFSYYGGVYNNFRREGEQIAPKRRFHIGAVDFSTELQKLTIKSEIALSFIDIPHDLDESLGDQQFGGFIDFIYPVYTTRLWNYENARLNAILRLERVDFNVGTFSATERNIQDDFNALTAGFSFRPNTNTVIKFNYRQHWIDDILGNPVREGGFQMGIATYF